MVYINGSETKVESVKTKIIAEIGNAQVFGITVDLVSIQEVEHQYFSETYPLSLLQRFITPMK